MLRILLYLTITLFSFSSAANINTFDAGKVMAGDKPIVLLGSPVKLGQKAPNFKVVDDKFNPVQLTDFLNKNLLISVVPSLDTGVCSLQTKFFNEKLAIEYPELVMLTISADLPFAQKRFCTAENINKVITLSDSVWHDFGKNYGLMIENMGLLTRTVLLLNKEHEIVYKQLVPSLSQEPDYISVTAAIKKL
ncbi:thiol peroxidase [Pseudoalteromonas denitrificans]|uniref:Thiol peroxidase, atypical 2-Cys peroxiredoxin n=1 Tax=Pseudoalteromonas denitrificans DSM 6059 TaxID=1123010 RepID=A0A1I1TB91_9GAMM|nr:thiol peroxidase [Pseudoalteromonas denitrificans]SFD55902.1 thiol peroxidase, atypical 2-Cys peroxiredoxin [Pseudoalteromonas denitrificans DSM 6059]